MTEREGLVYSPKVEVVFDTGQEKPFGVRKNGSQWQLSVNKMHFEAKGFLPEEIEGAIYLEEERLGKQIAPTSRSISGVRRWQDIASQDPKATTFKAAFERLAALASLSDKDPQRAASARKYIERFAQRSFGSDYSDQLFSAVLSEGLGIPAAPSEKVVDAVLNNLKKTEIVEDREVSPLEALLSPDLSIASKASWFEARFLPRLEFLEHQDRTKSQKEEKPAEPPKENQQQEENSSAPTPNPVRDEYEQPRGKEEKGKGQPIFVISPSFTGYWEEDSFDSIEESTGRLIKSSTQRIKTAFSKGSFQIVQGSNRLIRGASGTELFSLPLAPSFQLTEGGLKSLKSAGFEIFSDAEEHVFIKPPSNTTIEAEIAQNKGPLAPGINSRDTTTSEQKLPDEIVTMLEQIRSSQADSLGKIQEWKDFIRDFFKYPQDDQIGSMYSALDENPSRLEAMARLKLLDCHLAREFFIAGLKRLDLEDVEWRGVNGHYIASAQKDGTARIDGGTGHAWVKIRTKDQRNWIIIDPTPEGDPVHEGEGAIDAFGELTSEQLSEENLQEIEKEAKDTDKNRKVETQDYYLLQFAKEAGISPEEAQTILATLAKVDELKDSQGRNILALLKEQFDRIIQEYTSTRQENTGIVEMSRGQNLEDPVSAVVDLRTGSFDPLGFDRKRIVEETEKYYGGWDLEIIGDGSGSMNETSGGKVKYMVQRDMSYLLHQALHRFSQEAQRRKLRLVTPLKIRSSQYMFRGNSVEEIKQLTDEFTPVQMATLWKKSAENIHGGTPAHLGLQVVFDRITPEDAQLLKDKKLLKVVVLISDGGYDDTEKVNKIKKQLADLNVIVAEFRTNSARSLEELPQNVAGQVIDAAKILMPEKVKGGAS